MRARVLVADDEKAFLDEARPVLEARGLEVIEAYDGDTAIERLRHDRTIKGAVLDVAMPTLTGIEALCDIRPMYPLMPVGFVSIFGDGKTVALAKRATGDFYVWKRDPDALDKLADKLLAELHKREAAEDGRVSITADLATDLTLIKRFIAADGLQDAAEKLAAGPGASPIARIRRVLSRKIKLRTADGVEEMLVRRIADDHFVGEWRGREVTVSDFDEIYLEFQRLVRTLSGRTL